MYTIRDMPEPVPAELLTLLAGVETATVGHWRLQVHAPRDPAAAARRSPRRGNGGDAGHRRSGFDAAASCGGLLRPGDILVVDRLGDDKYACWGGGVTVAVKATGAVAGIVDGPCTDLAEIIASDFPIWARGLAPITTRLYDLGGGMNVPVSCGGAVVMPGDAVLADESGVLVIPRDEVLAVAERALAMQDTGKAREASVRDAGARLGELSGASAKVLAGLGKG